jgi:hypothetical protein
LTPRKSSGCAIVAKSPSRTAVAVRASGNSANYGDTGNNPFAEINHSRIWTAVGGPRNVRRADPI